MTALDTQVLETKIEGYFSKLPNLPSQFTQTVVSFSPYILLVGGILEVFTSGIFSLLGTGMPFFNTANKATGINYILSTVFSLLVGTIMMVAYKPLENRSIGGWRLLFYLNLIVFFESVFALLLGYAGDIVGTGVLFLIGFYLLFQVKKYYH